MYMAAHTLGRDPRTPDLLDFFPTKIAASKTESIQEISLPLSMPQRELLLVQQQLWHLPQLLRPG
jgi:hypothetical protein